MSYVAEPYAQFVDDLLTGLTGGQFRESFIKLESQHPFRLASENGILPASLQVYGQIETSSGERQFHRFRLNTDYQLIDGRDITWLAKSNGNAASTIQWPAEGSRFYANYQSAQSPGNRVPLTDRSPGSITRLLAETIGREYAVLSGQLERVYQSAFLDTASGNDLDNLVALVGLNRRGQNSAEGAITFSRSTPAPADITISAATRLSTRDVPAVAFETSQTVTLPRGQLSVNAPIQALETNNAGLVAAGQIVVINRPILGIDQVINSEATRFAAEKEHDKNLRARARRALEHGGQATIGALFGALTSLPGVREKDIRFSEDPIEHPGVVNLDLALPALSDEQLTDYKQRAISLIESSRPAGIRIRHNIQAPRPPSSAQPGLGQLRNVEGVPVVTGTSDNLHMPVDVKLVLQPTTLALAPDARQQLERRGQEVVEAYIADVGLGEALIYNQLVARLMAIEGVLDVAMQWYPSLDPDEGPQTANLMPNLAGSRAIAGSIDVNTGNALVALDLSATLQFTGAGTAGDQETNASAAASEIRSDLQQILDSFPHSQLDVAILKEKIDRSESFQVDQLHYRVDFIDDGVRINQLDLPLPYSGLEHFWIRQVEILDDQGVVIGSDAG